MNTIFIKDLENNQIGYHFDRLCVLADIEAPPMPKELIEFFRNKYWKYDATIIPRAIDCWLGGQYKIARPSKLHLPFITSLFNEFIQSNWNNIIKYKPVEIAAPQRTNEQRELDFEESMRLCTLDWIAVYVKHEKRNLFLKVMEINWNALVTRGMATDNFTETQINDMIEWIQNYERSYLKMLQNQSLKKTIDKAIQVNSNIEILRGAAKFALYLNTKYEIKRNH